MPNPHPCISYQVPLYELDRVREGVPAEELEKTKQPVIFIAPEIAWNGNPKSRKKPTS